MGKKKKKKKAKKLAKQRALKSTPIITSLQRESTPGVLPRVWDESITRYMTRTPFFQPAVKIIQDELDKFEYKPPETEPGPLGWYHIEIPEGDE